MRLITTIRQRWLDWVREVRITALAASVNFEMSAGRYELAMEAFSAMKAEIAQRSPQQVARMEARIRG